MSRCADCLHDIAPDAPRFVVVWRKTSDGEPSMSVTVCADCAGWYRDVIELDRPAAPEPMP